MDKNKKLPTVEVGDRIETQTPSGQVIDTWVLVTEVNVDGIKESFIGIDDENIECGFSTRMVSKVFRAVENGTYFPVWSK